MNLIQLISGKKRKVAAVDGGDLHLLKGFDSSYDLATHAISKQISLNDLIENTLSGEVISYDQVYEFASPWRILPAFDHPGDPNQCMLAGTGLTHRASAENRQKMHTTGEEDLNDSMKMYMWGLEGGQPNQNEIGVQPEWFYKGNGTILRGYGEDLLVPPYADDGGEEPEVAGIYLVDKESNPWRIGFSTANEFSDHMMEKKNYLYLAPSKIRECSIGPEMVVATDFKDLTGEVSISRKGEKIWTKQIATGEKNMAHSLANLEYHHFKYSNHRVPGQVHIHFFGADAFSFGEGICLADGDIMNVWWKGMGRPLRNQLKVSKEEEKLVTIRAINSI